MRPTPREISIIVPVLNEAAVIRAFLQELRQRAAGAEIIVADGGSSDKTMEIAADLCDRTVTSAPNRAVQMNGGANVSRGDILWFVHADVEVPPECLDEIQRALSDPHVVGGFFRIRLPRSEFIYRLTDNLAHYLGLLLRMRCGDHAIFCRRTVFNRIGGFPEVPIMEDAEFFRALYRCGKTCVLKKPVIVSSRRYEQIGPVRLTLSYGLIGALYAIGVPFPRLASIYARLCQPKR